MFCTLHRCDVEIGRWGKHAVEQHIVTDKHKININNAGMSLLNAGMPSLSAGMYH